MSKVQLANEIGLTARRIAAFENEGEVPRESTLVALGASLRFPPAFFMLADPPRPTEDGVSFRSFSRLPASRRDAALEAAALAVELGAWIEERFDLPPPDLPDLRDVGPREAAAALRVRWSLGNEPAPNMVHLLEARGVRVFSLTDDCKELDAYSLWYQHRPHVFLTRHKSPERARWDAAHELGHLLLHLEAPPNGKAQEVEADEFAGEFLLPSAALTATAPRHVTLADVRSHKLVWRVSALAYIRALERHGIITPWAYRSLVIEASQAGLRRTEGDIDRETSQAIPKILEILSHEGITIRDIAADLRVDTEEVRGLLFSSIAILQGGLGERTRPSGKLRLVSP